MLQTAAFIINIYVFYISNIYKLNSYSLKLLSDFLGFIL